MRNNEQTIFKPNASRPVYKFNVAGELVHTYTRTTDAIKEEHIPYSRLRELLESGNILRGHSFSLYPDKVAPIKKDDTALTMSKVDEMPWESNGMFDISGWGKVCL